MERKSTTIVLILVQLVHRCLSISLAAVSLSQRVMTTTLLPAKIGTCMPWIIPVTWKKGSVDKGTLPADTFPHTAAPTVLACTVRAVWMHPFGWPVVPEV